MVSIDKGGLAISMTSTINLIFGSQVMIPETGIIMNNEMNGVCPSSPLITPTSLHFRPSTNLEQKNRLQHPGYQ
jgi:hypothetical protein